MPKQYAVIVAGGKGLRMGGDIPKQFVPLCGEPVLMHTIKKFSSCSEIILVLPSEQLAYWTELCQTYKFDYPHKVVCGGETRYHSVYSGLQALAEQGIAEDDLVAVHDGVRPLVATTLIEECYRVAAQTGAALPYRPLVNSLRKFEGSEVTHAVERSDYVTVHTPQVFRLAPLMKAYARGYKLSFTDDASVWEDSGESAPSLVLSNAENIKLTTPIDLKLAELFLTD